MPCAVKIINGGSSLGVALPDTREELAQALRDTLRYGGHVIVEKKLFGRDIAVGVLGTATCRRWRSFPSAVPILTMPPSIRRAAAQEICPAPVTEKQQEIMGKATLRLHRRWPHRLLPGGLLWMRTGAPGVWRSIPCRDDPASLLPKEAAAAGLDFEALCQEILDQSLDARQAGR